MQNLQLFFWTGCIFSMVDAAYVIATTFLNKWILIILQVMETYTLSGKRLKLQNPPLSKRLSTISDKYELSLR